MPYDIEAAIYATKLAELKPGATVRCTTPPRFQQQVRRQVQEESRRVGTEDRRRADHRGECQRSEALRSAASPPPSRRHHRDPLGLQCPTFLTERPCQDANPGCVGVPHEHLRLKLFMGLAARPRTASITPTTFSTSTTPRTPLSRGSAFLDAMLRPSSPVIGGPSRMGAGHGRHLERR